MPKHLFLYFTLFFPFLVWSHPNIDRVPPEDRQKLERFFGYLIHNSVIGYSLCGEKPVSIETFPALYKIPIQYAVKIFVKHPGYSIVWNGIKTWQYYNHLFPSNNFVFRFIVDYDTIVFINKRATLKVIEDNLDLFQKYSNSKQTAFEFLEEVCCPKDKEYMIRYNPILLGILLGYGRHNAIAFSKKIHIQKMESFKLYNANGTLNAFINPGFLIVSANKEENKKIRMRFRVAKKNMENAFQRGNSFETFITLFTR